MNEVLLVADTDRAGIRVTAGRAELRALPGMTYDYNMVVTIAGGRPVVSEVTVRVRDQAVTSVALASELASARLEAICQLATYVGDEHETVPRSSAVAKRLRRDLRLVLKEYHSAAPRVTMAELVETARLYHDAHDAGRPTGEAIAHGLEHFTGRRPSPSLARKRVRQARSAGLIAPWPANLNGR